MQKQLFTYLLLASSLFAIGQKPAEEGTAKSGSFNRALSLDQKVEKIGEVTIKGQKVPYKVTASTQPVWDEEGKAVAGLFYVYYERTDLSNKATRPLVISFNGGPGTASVWMHLGLSLIHI
jgi:carboxypeptidase C (cathepsin A)